MAATNNVVILDRDGTIVVDRGYMHDPAALEFEPGAALGLQWLYGRGYRLIVITNQSGIGRGIFPAAKLDAMHVRLNAMVESVGVKLAGIYACPHTPESGCDCRKPAQGLMVQASRELGFDPASTIVIGDKASDVEFGVRAGAKTILIAASAAVTLATKPTVVVPNLMEAARAVTAGL